MFFKQNYTKTKLLVWGRLVYHCATQLRINLTVKVLMNTHQ